MATNQEKFYSLPAHIRVRKEEFGLLFYDVQSTGLIFINTGGLIKAEALKKGGKAHELAPDDPPKGEAVLAKLVAKGVVEC